MVDKNMETPRKGNCHITKPPTPLKTWALDEGNVVRSLYYTVLCGACLQSYVICSVCSVLSSFVITCLGEEIAGRLASCRVVCSDSGCSDVFQKRTGKE